MSNSIDFILTNSASELIQKVLNGKTLNFTRMVVGDGFCYDINVAKGFKNVVNEVLSLDITKKETLTPSSVKITSAFKNTDAQKEFYYREVGLYAQDPETGAEVLYAYGNRNDAAELITPAGTNIVSKQLIFVVSVGDSANVTFNVNADVYALQSDMLDVQANKADKTLANTGMITNCLLEVPQRIKWDLKDGTLTIKAGSVVIVPYGTTDRTSEFPVGARFVNDNFKVYDTQFTDGKFFVWAELINDITRTSDVAASDDVNLRSLCIVVTNNTFNLLSTTESGTGYAGTVADLQYYNISNNLVELYNSATVTGRVCSFPIMMLKPKDSLFFGSAEHIFNGMGYIGSTVWCDKDIKGLIPNGFQDNGTYKNIEYTTPKIFVKDFSPSTFPDIDFLISQNGVMWHNYAISQENISPNDSMRTYVPSKNLIYSSAGEIVQDFYFAKGSLENGTITSFIPYKPFRFNLISQAL